MIGHFDVQFSSDFIISIFIDLERCDSCLRLMESRDINRKACIWASIFT